MFTTCAFVEVSKRCFAFLFFGDLSFLSKYMYHDLDFYASFPQSMCYARDRNSVTSITATASQSPPLPVTLVQQHQGGCTVSRYTQGENIMKK